MSNILRESVRGTDLIPLEDMLLEESEVFLVDEITPKSANNLIQKLMYLDSKDLGEITIYINSPGGEVISGLAVYDYIKIMKSPVRTITIGDAASMGAIIFLDTFKFAELIRNGGKSLRKNISTCKFNVIFNTFKNEIGINILQQICLEAVFLLAYPCQGKPRRYMNTGRRKIADIQFSCDRGKS